MLIEEFKKDSRIVKKKKKKKEKKMPTYFQTTDEFTELNLKVILVPRATDSKIMSIFADTPDSVTTEPSKGQT